MRALLVDDEPLARSRLRRLLERIGDVTVCGEANDADSALLAIRTLAPDVVFLDIRMPGRDGLHLALEEPDLPPLIFTTAHDEFAVAAFEAAAIDYLLKPIAEARLRRSLERLRTRQAVQNPAHLVAALQSLLQREPPRGDRPRVHAQRGHSLHVFDADAIVRFRAEEKYTAFVQDGQEYLCEESLQSLERRLAASGFFRCHRSELIALAAVRKLLRNDDAYEVELRDGQRARVSRRAWSELRRLLGIDAGPK